MNIAQDEVQLIEARTCGNKNRRVAYRLIGGFHNLCIDKKDIMIAEIGACEMLLRECHEEVSRKAVEKEIAELKMALHVVF